MTVGFIELITRMRRSLGRLLGHCMDRNLVIEFVTVAAVIFRTSSTSLGGEGHGRCYSLYGRW
jgi:hypothetical protein